MPIKTSFRFRPLPASKHLLVGSVLGLAVLSFAEPPPAATNPESVGLSSVRLQRIHDLIHSYIESKAIPGAVTLIFRKGHTAYFEAQGLADIDSHKALQRDAIFRLASMTKPVTAVAVMMLQEEGKVRLVDPVSRFIPEFHGMNVAVHKDQAAGGPAPHADESEVSLVPANHDIRIQELLTHTSGVSNYSGSPPKRTERLIVQESRPTEGLAKFIPQIGFFPLDFQPGTQWKYSGLTAFEILGRVVEVASGMPFDRFLKERIFDPLGMKDTYFSPPEEPVSRLVVLYRLTANGLERSPDPNWLSSKVFFDGGGGLMSTAADYLQFAVMLLNGGQYNGKRLLGPKTVEWMASNQVGDLYSGNHGSNIHIPGMGFGLGGEVVLDNIRAGIHRSNGSYGWNGAFGTHFWVDFREKLVGILMIQVSANSFPQIWQLHDDYDNAVWQAIID